MGDVSHAAALEAGHTWTTKGPKMPALMQTVCGQICDFKACMSLYIIYITYWMKIEITFLFLSPPQVIKWLEFN